MPMAAQGLRIRDADGNEYLDFFGGILTVSVGHANHSVNAAIKAQIDRFAHVSTLYPTLPGRRARRAAGAPHAGQAEEELSSPPRAPRPTRPR